MRFNTPQWLYESMPAVYLLTGITAFFETDFWTAHVAGTALILASIYISVLRYRARSRPKPRARDTESPLLALTWVRGYEYDIPVIDREHKRLYEMSHELIQLLEEQRLHEFHQQVREVCHAILDHFTHEEATIRELVPAQLSEAQLRTHMQCHRKLAGKLHQLMQRFERGMVSRPQLLQFILMDVIRGHMLKDDSVALSGYTPAHAPRAPALRHA